MSNNTSSLLFANPSFIGGMASVVDIGATLTHYNESVTPEEADGVALWHDWCVIGKDIFAAMKAHEE